MSPPSPARTGEAVLSESKAQTVFCLLRDIRAMNTDIRNITSGHGF